MGYRVGIDVGGTFTDFMLIRPDGSPRVAKTSTTPDDESRGVLDGLARLADQERLSLGDLLERCDLIIHGTTTADNTMITMSGAKTGLITTEGHRDEIELRRGWKENIWDPTAPPPPPIARRRDRFGVPERLDFEGNVLLPLDEDAVREAVRRLRRDGIASIAVVLLFSFVNPAHERRVGEIIAEEYAGAEMVSLSHEVHPAAPEFERTSTTLVNAYVGPRVRRYLERLAAALRDEGFARDLLIMQSNGGIMTADFAARRPVATLGSGPAGGVLGACAVAARAGLEDFISVDMGGTSYDVCLVRGGKPQVKSFWNWQHRYLIALPMVDVLVVGAGGGSIARVKAGGLSVGPESAGAVPGPICYGRGGIEPTVTDANLMLGYLNPERFAGGQFSLRREGVEETIAERIAGPLGLEPVEAAWGIYRLVNANMNNAIRRASSQRGQDPRRFSLLVFGGGGPVHAAAQAEELGISRLLVPRTAPVFSALGLLSADYLVDGVRSYIVTAQKADLGRVNALFREMLEAAVADLARAGIERGSVVAHFYAECRYPGQTFHLEVPLQHADGEVSDAELQGLVESFHRLHEELHTYARPEEEVVITGLRLRATGVTEKPEPAPAERARAASAGYRPRPEGERPAFFGDGFVSTPVFDGDSIAPPMEVDGPAIVEEPFTTVVVPPGWRMTLDDLEDYVLEV